MVKKHYDEIVRFMEEEIPFNKHLGLKIVEISEGYCKLILPYQNIFIGDKRRPALHGGVINTIIDVCSGTAVWTYFKPEDAVATLDILVDYLRPAPDEDLHVESRVERVGNRVAMATSKVFSSSNNEKILAVGRAVYNIWKADKA